MLKSPTDLAAKLAKQWYNNDIRQRRLLCADEWPLEIPIGKPPAQLMTTEPAQIREHLNRWRNVSIGHVHWQHEKYRGISQAVSLPRYWQLNTPSEWVAACDNSDIKKEFCHFEQIIEHIDKRYHPLIIRQRTQVLARPAQEVIQAAKIASELQPGSAQGKPLRLLSIGGCDSKFFERNRVLITQMLNQRFGSVIDEVGLEGFLDALDERDHWLLVAPLEKGLLPFRQQRVRARELSESPLPGSHVLVVENERCVYQLPPLPGVIAILGAGLNLNWLASNIFNEKTLGYWGDIDTWGFKMLAKARAVQPGIAPLMMDSDTFNQFETISAVAEPMIADREPPQTLTAPEALLYFALVGKQRGRLEQEFVDSEWVKATLHQWLRKNFQDVR